MTFKEGRKSLQCVSVLVLFLEFPPEFGEAGLESTVIPPLTTKALQEDAFPLRVRIPKGTAGLERDSDVLVDQVLAWDNSLFHKELGMLPDALIEKVTSALKEFLDI